MMSETFEIQGDKALMRELQRIVTSTEAVLGLAAEVGARVIDEAADAKAPGPHIETEVTERTRTRATRDIGPDQEHWYYSLLERGVRPHTIRGNPRLAFEGREGTVFPREVQHPGFAARPFLRPAYDEQRDDAVKRVGEALKGAIMTATVGE